ncbi:hypothetical protein GGR56DRAFT_678285 [Xylariaceae sp. FL0804]|nr:hypothetical protein GGR56DRAFT_678285 [Xylariaceae sp. FL0804]
MSQVAEALDELEAEHRIWKLDLPRERVMMTCYPRNVQISGYDEAGQDGGESGHVSQRRRAAELRRLCMKTTPCWDQDGVLVNKASRDAIPAIERAIVDVCARLVTAHRVAVGDAGVHASMAFYRRAFSGPILMSRLEAMLEAEMRRLELSFENLRANRRSLRQRGTDNFKRYHPTEDRPGRKVGKSPLRQVMIPPAVPEIQEEKFPLWR